MTAKFDALKNAVEGENTVLDSMLALVNNLQQNQDDPAAMQSLIDEVNAKSATIAAALVAGTPAASVPVGDPGTGTPSPVAPTPPTDVTTTIPPNDPSIPPTDPNTLP